MNMSIPHRCPGTMSVHPVYMYVSYTLFMYQLCEQGHEEECLCLCARDNEAEANRFTVSAVITGMNRQFLSLHLARPY